MRNPYTNTELESAFLNDCIRFYQGGAYNPTVSNMTTYGIKAERALQIMDIAKSKANEKYVAEAVKEQEYQDAVRENLIK